ncbi:hypothetical protein MKW98_018682 [Papaver atlanticum]|uniref:Uncharacterized protein n=1 Tax=Papaver atlanticum TaxID=357466 RepID=A0AAD4T4Y2_9MAGN|nr:hypothetical protein MKW98_018682 [Papaver atlanticum]
MKNERKRQRRHELDSPQRSNMLQQRGILERAKQSSMTIHEREASNEKRRNQYRIRSSQQRLKNKESQQAGTISAMAGTRAGDLNLLRSPQLTQHFQTQPEMSMEGGLPPPITLQRTPALFEQNQERAHTQNAIPMESDQVPVLKPTTQVYRETNPTVESIFSTLRSAFSQTTIRIQNARIDFLVGPIHVVDGTGKEMATQITANTETTKALYTDSSGRDFKKKNWSAIRLLLVTSAEAPD